MSYPKGKPRKYNASALPEDKDGCVLWQGAVDCHGHPVRFFNGLTIRVRQEVFQATFGHKPSRLLANSCGKATCIAAAHLRENTIASNKQQAAATRIFLRLAELNTILERLTISISMLEGDKTAEAVEATIHFQNDLKLALEEQQKLLILQQQLTSPTNDTGEEETNDSANALEENSHG
jgi:hypothetical protein